MKFAPLLCLTICLSSLAVAEPAKAPAKPFNLPVIEIHQATPVDTPEPVTPPGGTIELTPIEGPKAEKMTGTGRANWGAYGSPGRAWPNASPPGTPGATGGGMMSPAGIPSRF